MKLFDTHHFYMRSMGKLLRVTAIFTSAEEANKYLERQKGQEGVVGQVGPYIIIASMYDTGQVFDAEPVSRTPKALTLVEFVNKVVNSQPDALPALKKEAANVLEKVGNWWGGRKLR